MKFLKKLLFSTYTRGFVSAYLLFMFTGAALLKLPMSIQEGESLSWIDAIFVSVSGMSTTGLSTVVVKDVFTTVGKIFLALILQFGGIGLIMFISIFWLAIGKKINFRERNMIMTDQNQIRRSGVVKFIKNILIIVFSIELVGFLIMGNYLWIAGYYELKEAYFQAFFLTISMFTNAGFDIAGDSLFRYSSDYFMQTLAMSLMFLGAVGFWPLVEFKEWILAKKKKEKFEFSLFTKVLFFMHLSIWIFSALFVYLVEFNNFLIDKDFFEGIYYAVFMSLTTRNAGFATMNMTDFSETTQTFFGILMFIGSSPNSAGGGVRTTTALLTILGLYSFAIGRDQVIIKKRSVKKDTVYRSFFVVIGAIMLLFLNLVLMTLTETHSVQEIFFEIASAFGTTGLSLGITQSLSPYGKIILIVTMFIGRIGILALLLLFKGKKNKNNIRYPEVDIIVG